MAKSLLLQNTDLASEQITPFQEIPKINTDYQDSEKNRVSESDKNSLILQKINSTKEKMVIPEIDFNFGTVSYPILEEIGENKNNIEYLENLSSDNISLLEKIIYEKFLVCPTHPDSFSVSVRLYCPSCKSINIEKLYLVEHSKCGFIAEKKKFVLSKDEKISQCPQCKKEILDEKKELHVPGMWYVCDDCQEKFDDVSVKLYCRNYKHDFEIQKSKTINIFGFKIKDDEGQVTRDTSILSDKLTKLLHSFEFSSEINYSLKGRSGQYHHIDIFAKNKNSQTVLIFLKKSDNDLDNSEINSKIIQVMDTVPTLAILVGYATISEKAKTIASGYNVSIIAPLELEEIISRVETILNEKLSQKITNVEK